MRWDAKAGTVYQVPDSRSIAAFPGSTPVHQAGGLLWLGWRQVVCSIALVLTSLSGCATGGKDLVREAETKPPIYADEQNIPIWVDAHRLVFIGYAPEDVPPIRAKQLSIYRAKRVLYVWDLREMRARAHASLSSDVALRACEGKILYGNFLDREPRYWMGPLGEEIEVSEEQKARFVSGIGFAHEILGCRPPSRGYMKFKNARWHLSEASIVTRGRTENKLGWPLKGYWELSDGRKENFVVPEVSWRTKDTYINGVMPFNQGYLIYTGRPERRIHIVGGPKNGAYISSDRIWGQALGDDGCWFAFFFGAEGIPNQDPSTLRLVNLCRP